MAHTDRRVIVDLTEVTTPDPVTTALLANLQRDANAACTRLELVVANTTMQTHIDSVGCRLTMKANS